MLQYGALANEHYFFLPYTSKKFNNYSLAWGWKSHAEIFILQLLVIPLYCNLVVYNCRGEGLSFGWVCRGDGLSLGWVCRGLCLSWGGFV